MSLDYRGVEQLFDSFWKERREVRKGMVEYALRMITKEYLKIDDITEFINKEYGLTTFPGAIVLDLLDNEFKQYVIDRKKDSWKLKLPPGKPVEDKIGRVAKIFQTTHDELFDPICHWPEKGSFRDIVEILIDVVCNEVGTIHGDQERYDFISSGRGFINFDAIALEKLKKKGYVNETEARGLLQVFKTLWKQPEPHLVQYLVDYTSVTLRLAAIKAFEEKSKTITLGNIKIILDGNVIFPLILESNEEHIIAQSGVKSAIDKKICVEILDITWDEFKSNITRWDMLKATPGGWLSHPKYTSNEILLDFNESKLPWDEYFKITLKKKEELKCMGISIKSSGDVDDTVDEIREPFKFALGGHYEVFAPMDHDLKLAAHFIECSKKGPCWLISRHGKFIRFINERVVIPESGALHLKEFHGWMTELLAMTFSEETWKSTAKHLLNKTLLSNELRTPQSLTKFVGMLIQWQDNLAGLEKILVEMPRYESLLKHWVTGDERSFETILTEALPEHLRQQVHGQAKEIEEMRVRLIEARKISIQKEIDVQRSRCRDIVDMILLHSRGELAQKIDIDTMLRQIHSTKIEEILIGVDTLSKALQPGEPLGKIQAMKKTFEELARRLKS